MSFSDTLAEALLSTSSDAIIAAVAIYRTVVTQSERTPSRLFQDSPVCAKLTLYRFHS